MNVKEVGGNTNGIKDVADSSGFIKDTDESVIKTNITNKMNKKYIRTKGDMLFDHNLNDKEMSNSMAKRSSGLIGDSTGRAIVGAKKGYSRAREEGRSRKNSIRTGVVDGAKSVVKGIARDTSRFDTENDNAAIAGITKMKNTYQKTKTTIHMGTSTVKGIASIPSKIKGAAAFIKGFTLNTGKTILRGVALKVGGIGLLLVGIILIPVMVAGGALNSIMSFSFLSDPLEINKVDDHLTNKYTDFMITALNESEDFLKQEEANNVYHVNLSIIEDGAKKNIRIQDIQRPDINGIMAYLTITDDSWFFFSIEHKLNQYFENLYSYNKQLHITKKEVVWEEKVCDTIDPKKCEMIEFSKEINVNTLNVSIKTASWEKYIKDNGNMMWDGFENEKERYINIVELGSIIYQDLQSPFEGFWEISSPYGYRINPLKNDVYEKSYHDAIDIPKPLGTEIKATMSGIVEVPAFKGDGLGHHVIIRRGDKKTVYGHCSKVLVQNGQEVSVGDTIALVGSTGASTGNHVHFKYAIEDSWVNPIYYIQK